MRYLLTLLAVLVLLCGLAACNPKEEEGGDSSENAAGRKPDFSQEEQTEPVKLGFSLELTGDSATFGISAKRGAEIAIDEINENGGLFGHDVEVVFDDNACVSDQAVRVASKLINQDKVDVIIGALTSSLSIAMARLAEESQVPMVSPASTHPAVTVDNGVVRNYVFRTCFTDDFQGEGIVNFAIHEPVEAKKAVIFYDSENDYSVGIYETVKRTAPEQGLEIVAEDTYLSKSEQDFRAKLNRFKSSEFDVMIVPGFYNDVAKIANQARELGIDQTILGGDGFDSPDLWKNAGKNIEGCYFTNHYAVDDMDPAVQNYITKFKQYYGGSVPDAMSILTYDAVKVVADAITRAGSTDHEAIAKALAETDGYKGAAGVITIDENHNATKKLVVLQIGENGNLKWVYTFDPMAEQENEVVEIETSENDGSEMIPSEEDDEESIETDEGEGEPVEGEETIESNMAPDEGQN